MKKTFDFNKINFSDINFSWFMENYDTDTEELETYYETFQSIAATYFESHIAEIYNEHGRYTGSYLYQKLSNAMACVLNAKYYEMYDVESVFYEVDEEDLDDDETLDMYPNKRLDSEDFFERFVDWIFYQTL